MYFLTRKTFLIRLGFALALYGLFFVSTAYADESAISFTADSNVVLPGKGGTLVIESGSRAESITINTNDMSVQVGSGGDTFVLKDTDASRRLLFKVDGAVTGTCTSSQSSISLGPTATTTYTIEPMPDLTCSNTPPSGGSSGGSFGGGGSSTTPAPAPAPSPTPKLPSEPPIPTSAVGAHPNGTLILDNGTIYLIVNGKKRGFRNPEEYFSHGYKFSQTVPANDVDRGLPEDAIRIVKALDGALALDKTDLRTIYMIAAGKKRGFTSAEVFQGLGYKFSQAVLIDLSDYEAGPPIVKSEEPHPDGALVLDSNGTVWWILNNTRQGFQSAEVFFTYGFKFSQVVPANAADMTLPEGPLEKFRDGTIVKDGDFYFLISDGMKKRFASVDVLQRLGYDSNNAISASLTSYTETETIQ